MPYNIRKNPRGGYDLVKKSTGKVVSHHATKRKAHISAGYRTRGERK